MTYELKGGGVFICKTVSVFVLFRIRLCWVFENMFVIKVVPRMIVLVFIIQHDGTIVLDLPT